jgi:hypothetical protein
MATDWIAKLQERFLAERYSGSAAVRVLPAEESQLHASQVMKETRGATEVDGALRARGLAPMITRARAYLPFSRNTARVRMVCVIPYTSADPKSTLVGAVGVSEGEPVSGIVVELEQKLVTHVTAYDYIGGKLIEKSLSAPDLVRDGPKKFVERWKREKTEPNLTPETAMAIGQDAFRSFLVDDHAALVYSEADIRQLALNAPVLSAIAELQYLRHLGVPSATSCCCCTTTSWGSCSCSCAVSKSYISPHFPRGS